MPAPTLHKRLAFPVLTWLAAIIAAGLAVFLRGDSLVDIWPLALVAILPALISLVLLPWISRDWAQMLVVIAWTALAIFAVASFGILMVPLLILAPAAAMLFARGRVIEALVLAIISAAALFWAQSTGVVPEMNWSDKAADWAVGAGLLSTLAFLLTSMISAAGGRDTASDMTPRTLWRAGVDGGLFEFDKGGKLLGHNDQGAAHFDLATRIYPARFDSLMAGDTGSQDRLNHIRTKAHETGTAQMVRLSMSPHTTETSRTTGQVDEGDGAKVTYDLRVTPLAHGGTLLHTTDRTVEDERLEAMRRAQTVALQDSASKTLFFAGVSHELRTPLNAIIGFSDIMRSRLFGPLPGKYAEYADLIHDSGQHMLDLIGDVLDLSKVEAGKYELNYDTFDMADVVRSSVKMLRPSADAAKVTLETDLDSVDPMILQADRRAVRQVLLNLLSNAVKFAPKGSRVKIIARQVLGEQIFEVSDAGPGMSAEEISRIGQPYAQTKSAQTVPDRGSGLGLSLVRSLVDLHQGRMDINSAPGQGTTVTIHLPVLRG